MKYAAPLIPFSIKNSVNCRSGPCPRPRCSRAWPAPTGAWPKVFWTQTKLLSFLMHIGITLLLALSTATSTQAGSLGRLFFTPEQRAQLEYKRVHNATVAAGSGVATTEESGTSSVLTVNGIVQKKGGARTVWINGKAQNAGSSDEHNPESLPVSVPGQSRPVKLKVGQKLILEQPAQKEPPASAPQEKQPAGDD